MTCLERYKHQTHALHALQNLMFTRKTAYKIS